MLSTIAYTHTNTWDMENNRSKKNVLKVSKVRKKSSGLHMKGQNESDTGILNRSTKSQKSKRLMLSKIKGNFIFSSEGGMSKCSDLQDLKRQYLTHFFSAKI